MDRDVVVKRDGGFHFPCLDGYRAFAATGVALYHVTIAFSFFQNGTAPRWNAPLGDYAVCLFFVLSGFLLYRPYAVAHRDGGTDPSWRRFWLRRAARIVPGYWLAVFALMVFFASNETHTHGFLDYFTFFSFTQIYRTGFATKGLDVAWTLCIELSFYLALPFLAALGGGWRPARRSDNRLIREMCLLGAMFVIGMGYRILLLDHPPGWSKKWLEPRYWLPYYFDWFALGMLLAILHVWWQGKPLPKVLDVLGRYPSICMAVGLAGYVWLVLLNPPRALGQAGAVSTRQIMLRFALDGLCVFILLVPAVFGDQDVGITRRVLRNRVVQYIGLVSFGVYLWHPMWIHQLEVWRRHSVLVRVNGLTQAHRVGWFPVSVPAAFVVAVTLAVLTASLSYWLLEKPIVDAAARWARARPTGQTGGGRTRRAERPMTRPGDDQPEPLAAPR